MNRGVLVASFMERPKIVHVSPWLQFSQLADTGRFYQSCRFGLLAYCAFPNRHLSMRSGQTILALDDEAARALFEEFLTADSTTRTRWGWNRPPLFLVSSWKSAQKSDARRTAAARKKKDAAAQQLASTTRRYIFDDSGDLDGNGDGGDDGRDQDASSDGLGQFRFVYSSLSERMQRRITKLWKDAEDHEKAPAHDEDTVTLHRATEAWLRRKRWGQKELHDALVLLGSALPSSLSGRRYLDRLRVLCRDPGAMAMPCGNFPIKVLKPAMQRLSLGVAGTKQQLVDRLVLALEEDTQAAGDADAADASAGVVDVEEDFGRSAAATTFAARASAAWQEYSGGGAHVYEDALEDLLDAEEADVRAEQEALLQLRAGVNPTGLSLEALKGSVSVLTGAHCERVLGAKRRSSSVAPAPTLFNVLDPTQRAVHDRVFAWAQQLGGQRGAPPPAPCRMILLGTAGTGKSDTIRAIVESTEHLLGEGVVMRAAHTGVAAFNMGNGAETINSVFRLGQKLTDAVVSELEKFKLIILDEISMVGSAQFYEVSNRMEEVARTAWRRQHERSKSPPPEPASFGGFGGCAVLLVGDFGQLPPIGDPSLIAPAKGQSREAAAGQRIFKTFQEVVRLRRIYRQRGRSAFKDSKLRLRDVALTLEDYE